jgi:hypothetical protein
VDLKRTRSARERLRRSAHRFLALNSRLGSNGDVLFRRDRAEVIFWYVSALENLLLTEGRPDGDFSRKVAQRAAVLIGADDDERLAIRRDITKAYSVRSKVAHGDTPPDALLTDLPQRLRDYLRRAFRDLIILGPMFDVAEVCDDALLSGAIREQKIAVPVQDVAWSAPTADG